METDKGVDRATFTYDRLYGHLDFSEDELALFQTPELTRLRQISVSAIPTWTIPTGVCASRFEHSVGVAHLARIVGEREEFRDIARDLHFAGLAHDLGTPPFSHAAEYFQVKILGRNHEEAVREILNGSEFADQVKRQGGNLDTISRLVTGELPPISAVLNGSIDIDNLDNSLRYGLSMGLLTKPAYSPESLAQAYAMRNDEVVLLPGYEEELNGWEQTRQQVYEYVYGPANLSPGMLLFRAMDFAYREGELSPEFFTLTDTEAAMHLSSVCNPRTRELMERANRWTLYPRVYDVSVAAPNEDHKAFLLEPDNRGIVADELAGLLSAEPEDVCVYMGRNKGPKKIHLRVLGKEHDQVYEPESQPIYMTQVYVHPRLSERGNVVRDYMKERLAA